METRAEILSHTAGILVERDLDGTVPDFIIAHVNQKFDCLSDSNKAIGDCSGSAHAIAQWYIDQGFPDVPVHRALSDIALEIINYVDNK